MHDIFCMQKPSVCMLILSFKLNVMKRKFIFFAALLIALFTFTNTTFAQDLQKQNEETKPSFKSRLYFNSDLNLGFGKTFYQAGIAPSIGYKITDKYSMGLRLPLSYNRTKFSWTNSFRDTYEGGLGLFSRYKIGKYFFAHAEYNFLISKSTNINVPRPDSFWNNSLRYRDELNIGFGVRTKGKFGVEATVLYDVLDPSFLDTSNFQLRLGLNYKF